MKSFTVLGFEIGMSYHHYQNNHEPIHAIMLGICVALAIISLSNDWNCFQTSRREC